VDAIVAKRLAIKRSAEVVHLSLQEAGIVVSLSSVKRTLDRRHLTKKRSPWQRYHAPSERPVADHPGALIQVDTIHLAVDGKTVLYVFTLIDVYSRWAYARAYGRANARTALALVKRAQTAAPFLFECIQTDHGPEFSTHFSERVRIRHRHSRVRRPNDNAHIERFNRTIQEELLTELRVELYLINRRLPAYLRWYNRERHHFGIGLKKPMQLVA
jgi:transposase InsO family protein